MDIFKNTSDNELHELLLSFLLKAKREINCAHRDITKQKTRIDNQLQLVNELITREEKK